MRNTLLMALLMTCLTGRASDNIISDEGAWCWFADPRALHYENAAEGIDVTWLAYIDVHGNVKATQMDFAKGEQTEVLVRSFFQPDDHNNPTFLVLPDERVMVIYSRHTDEPAFYYRVSQRKADITTLGYEHKIVTENNTTYPSPFIMSDDPEHFYLCWRGSYWHPTIARLPLPDEQDEGRFDWGPHQMVQSTGARPYAKYYSNGKDKLYVAYTTGHPDNELPNWLYFNVVDIAGGRPTLNTLDGQRLSVIEEGPFHVSKTEDYAAAYPSTILDRPGNVRDWVWQIALDAEERPRVAMVKISPDKQHHTYAYARYTGSAWQINDICYGGGKFHTSPVELCYSGGMSIDQQRPQDVYLSRPTNGVYELWRYTMGERGVQDSVQLTINSVKNNVRPFVTAGSLGSKQRLGWMQGDYHFWMVRREYPLGYPTRMMSDYAIAPRAERLKWSIELACEMDAEDYEGVVIEAKDFTYGIDDKLQQPYVTTAQGTEYSPSRLLSSDGWAENSYGTRGDNWPTKLTSVTLRLTYDGTTLRTYRNGTLDQSIDVKLGKLRVRSLGKMVKEAR